MDFFARLDSIVKDRKTALCVGLDPRIPESEPDPAGRILELNRRIIARTAEFAACFKPNIAFYEAFGPVGLEALRESLSLIPKDIPVLIDAKRCDIDATAEAYARAIFDTLGADAVTLSPYMGRDTATPFLAHPDKGLFLLARTSNPGAGALQDLIVEASTSVGGQARGQSRQRWPREPLYIRTARECLSWSPRIGLVVAGNDLHALSRVREAAPDAWFLAPGIGAQGGDPAAAFRAGCRRDGSGILVVAARAVADAADPAVAARDLRDAMEKARCAAMDGMRPASSQGFGPGTRAPAGASVPKAAQAEPDGLKLSLIDALIRTECFRLGEFLLKSGKKSPFYIDLRRLVSDPEAMAVAGEAYARLADGLDYTRIAGIPAAGLPLATAASLATRMPMIWPRMPVKEHGTGNRIEGAYKPGEKVLLLDDLITTGASKLEAVEILRGEGLVVEELVVLIERGKDGRRDMEAAGIELKAFLGVKEVFAACEALGLVDAKRRLELEAYVDGE
jgi:uridine monophosphate synthetase